MGIRVPKLPSLLCFCDATHCIGRRPLTATKRLIDRICASLYYALTATLLLITPTVSDDVFFQDEGHPRQCTRTSQLHQRMNMRKANFRKESRNPPYRTSPLICPCPASTPLPRCPPSTSTSLASYRTIQFYQQNKIFLNTACSASRSHSLTRIVPYQLIAVIASQNVSSRHVPPEGHKRKMSAL